MWEQAAAVFLQSGLILDPEQRKSCPAWVWFHVTTEQLVQMLQHVGRCCVTWTHLMHLKTALPNTLTELKLTFKTHFVEKLQACFRCVKTPRVSQKKSHRKLAFKIKVQCLLQKREHSVGKWKPPCCCTKLPIKTITANCGLSTITDHSNLSNDNVCLTVSDLNVFTSCSKHLELFYSRIHKPSSNTTHKSFILKLLGGSVLVHECALERCFFLRFFISCGKRNHERDCYLFYANMLTC